MSNEIRMEISIPTDDDGYVLLQCEHCGNFFKLTPSDIEDDGTVYVAGVDQEMLDKAISIIESLTKDVELNEVYMGKVTKLFQFGALVEILPGKEGLLHISKISNERVNKVEDVLSVGDEILVKVVEIGKEDGKFSLSAKDAMKV